jgi:hypothetical protein
MDLEKFHYFALVEGKRRSWERFTLRSQKREDSKFKVVGSYQKLRVV